MSPNRNSKGCISASPCFSFCQFDLAYKIIQLESSRLHYVGVLCVYKLKSFEAFKPIVRTFDQIETKKSP